MPAPGPGAKPRPPAIPILRPLGPSLPCPVLSVVIRAGSCPRVMPPCTLLPNDLTSSRLLCSPGAPPAWGPDPQCPSHLPASGLQALLLEVLILLPFLCTPAINCLSASGSNSFVPQEHLQTSFLTTPPFGGLASSLPRKGMEKPTPTLVSLPLGPWVSETTGFFQDRGRGSPVAGGERVGGCDRVQDAESGSEPSSSLRVSGRYSGLKGRKRLKDAFWQ